MNKLVAMLAFVSLSAIAADAPLVVKMNVVDADGIGAAAGSITVTESPYGLVFTPALTGLPPGLHGLHVHQNPTLRGSGVQRRRVDPGGRRTSENRGIEPK